MENSRCMKCGCITYEGRHICLTCEGTDDMQTFKRQKMPPKTNRDKLSQVDMHDLLCRMQKNAEKHHKSGAYACVIAYLEGESPIWRCAEFMENKRASCNKCIAAYLNEEVK